MFYLPVYLVGFILFICLLLWWLFIIRVLFKVMGKQCQSLSFENFVFVLYLFIKLIVSKLTHCLEVVISEFLIFSISSSVSFNFCHFRLSSHTHNNVCLIWQAKDMSAIFCFTLEFAETKKKYYFFYWGNLKWLTYL